MQRLHNQVVDPFKGSGPQGELLPRQGYGIVYHVPQQKGYILHGLPNGDPQGLVKGHPYGPPMFIPEDRLQAYNGQVVYTLPSGAQVPIKGHPRVRNMPGQVFHHVHPQLAMPNPHAFPPYQVGIGPLVHTQAQGILPPPGLPNLQAMPSHSKNQLQQAPNQVIHQQTPQPPLSETGQMCSCTLNCPPGQKCEQPGKKNEPVVGPISPEEQQAYIDGPPSDDLTSIHWDQVSWSIYNLPDILYIVKPGEQHKISKKPIQWTKEKIFGKHVRDFAVLPDQISSWVEGWRCETWRRLDRRIVEQDIIDRINPKYRQSVPVEKVYLRQNRFRRMFHLSSWESIQSFDRVAGELKAVGIDPSLNSTRGLTPGLKQPELGEDGGRVPLPKIICFTDALSSVKPLPPQYQSLLPKRGKHIDRVPGSAMVSTPSRKATDDPESSSGPAKKKMKLEDILNQEHPSPNQSELAHCGGPPARKFPKETDTNEKTMMLDEYLSNRNLRYADFLRDRYENKGVANRLPMSNLSTADRIFDP